MPYFRFRQSADHLRDLLELCGYSPEASEAILKKTELADDEDDLDLAPEHQSLVFKKEKPSPMPVKGQRSLPNTENETFQNRARQQKYEAETSSRHSDEEVKARLILLAY